MANEEFHTPEPIDFLETFGVEPILIDEDVFEIDLSDVAEEPVRITFNPMARSVRLVWNKGGESIVDIFREGASRLRIEENGGESRLCVDFSLGGAAGTLYLTVFPTLRVSDELLLR